MARSWLLLAVFSHARAFLRPAARRHTFRVFSTFGSQDFIEKQRRTSASAGAGTDHYEHQVAVFDELSEWFASEDAVPDDLVPVYRSMVTLMLETTRSSIAAGLEKRRAQNVTEEELSSTMRVLDVATGTGVFWPYLLEAADALDVKLDIQAVDLSPKMVEQAKTRATELSGPHSIAVEVANVEEYACDTKFDMILANACFGNFWDQRRVLEQLADLIVLDGSLWVSHPLGASFVDQLHQEDPRCVPNLLPRTESAWKALIHGLPLICTSLVNTLSPSDSVYLANLQRVRQKLLPKVVRLRGEVDSGYGRGGKKLGFPTANLPSRLFQDALLDVAPGVYYGYAVIEGSALGRNVIHEAVVNVGYSPTFQGEENKEKIVEAHVMTKSPLTDFYGETMRLQLHGFIRPEIKFPSFPALIAQIRADVADTKAILCEKDSEYFRSDPFLSARDTTWIGKTGGNESASWEIEEFRDW